MPKWLLWLNRCSIRTQLRGKSHSEPKRDSTSDVAASQWWCAAPAISRTLTRPMNTWTLTNWPPAICFSVAWQERFHDIESNHQGSLQVKFASSSMLPDPLYLATMG